MEIIQQRYEYDCVIASIAMWANLSYEDVMGVCVRLGYERDPDSRKGLSSVEGYSICRKLGIRPFVIDEAYGGVKGILSLPSLNHPGGAHAVFYDGRDIHDPQTGKEGKQWYANNLLFWPGCYKLTLDLNDAYSREMAEFWLEGRKQIFENAITGRF